MSPMGDLNRPCAPHTARLAGPAALSTAVGTPLRIRSQNLFIGTYFPTFNSTMLGHSMKASSCTNTLSYLQPTYEIEHSRTRRVTRSFARVLEKRIEFQLLLSAQKQEHVHQLQRRAKKEVLGRHESTARGFIKHVRFKNKNTQE